VSWTALEYVRKLRSDRVTVLEKHLLNTLAYRDSDIKGYCCPFTRYIIEDTLLSRTQVFRLLKSLEEKDILFIFRRMRKDDGAQTSNIYIFIDLYINQYKHISYPTEIQSPLQETLRRSTCEVPGGTCERPGDTNEQYITMSEDEFIITEKHNGK